MKTMRLRESGKRESPRICQFSRQPVLLQSGDLERVLESTGTTLLVTEQNMVLRSTRNGIHSWHSLESWKLVTSRRRQSLKNSERDLGENKRYHKSLFVASQDDTLDIVE